MKKEGFLNVPATQTGLTGVIDSGCEFEGKLCFQGTFRINGTFRGEIYSADTLIIGEGARVNAKIDAGVVILHGELHGEIKAKHRVEMHRPAFFKGEVLSPSLSVAEGVIFQGTNRVLHVSNFQAEA